MSQGLGGWRELGRAVLCGAGELEAILKDICLLSRLQIVMFNKGAGNQVRLRLHAYPLPL